MHFEAGSISHALESNVCTYLCAGLQRSDVAPPLGMFQHTTATKDDTLQMLRTINAVINGDHPLPNETLKRSFEKFGQISMKKYKLYPIHLAMFPSIVPWSR